LHVFTFFCLDRAFAEAASRRQAQKETKKSRAKYAAHPHAGPPPHLARPNAPARHSACIQELIGRLAVVQLFFRLLDKQPNFVFGLAEACVPA